MVSFDPMARKKSPMGNKNIRVSAEAWAAAERVAEALGCLGKGSEPSVGVLILEIGEGTITAVRVRPPIPRSVAQRVRQLITEHPDASNREIADMIPMPGEDGLVRVITERKRMIERARRKAEAEADE